MLISAIAASAAVAAAPMEVRLMRYPNVFEDKVVFTFASDLWVSDLEGGVARRLTSHPGLEYRARYSPDGSQIAFSGQYDGSTDVYVMSADGGQPKRLTMRGGSEMVLGWTPDGQIAYSTNSTHETRRGSHLFLVDPEGGMPVPTAVKDVSDISFSPDGKTIAMNRGAAHQFNWRGYRGGTQGVIGFFDLEKNTWKELPHKRENSWFPMWVGSDVFFISDKTDRTKNLYKWDTKAKKQVSITKNKDSDIRWPSTDGKTIVWERDGQIEAYDVKSGKINAFRPRILTDNLAMRPRYRNFGSSVEDFALSPSGKRIALAARGDLFSAPAKNGVTRRLTSDTSSRETSPSWSPDGQEIAFMSDESGEQQIYVKPQMGGEAELIPTPRGEVISSVQWSPKGTYLAFTTIDNGFGFVNRKTGDSRIVHKDKLGNLPFDFSHDESWIVYSAVQDNLFAAVMLYNVEDKTHHQVTSGLYNSQSASFDLNGKYLYFSSDRSYAPNFDAFAGASLHQTDTTRIYMTTLRTDLMNPLDKPEDEEPVKKAEGEEKPAGDAPAAEKPKGLQIDIEGLEQRAQALPWPPGQYPFVIGANNGVFTWSAGALVKFDAASGAPMTIMPGVSSLDFNPTRTKMAYRSGSTIGITDVRPGLKPGAGAVNTSNVGYMWNPQDEYEQMFWEAWRYERDHFYDKDLLGLDWKAIGDKYAAMLPYVGDRSDLNYIFGMLVGELGTGHAYVMGGDVAQGATPEAPTAAGMLGVDYAVENGKVRLAKIYRGFNTDASAKGPLGAPGVDARQGDYLMAIDGHPVDASVNVDSLLIGKVGQIVELALNSDPVDIGSRIVKVRPIASESSLRYATWQDERRNLVDEWSNGQIGYMHVPDTSVPGIINFVRGFYSQSGKKAWVIDERDNGGGSIPTFFIEALARQFDTAFKQRHGVDVGFPTQSLDGPKVMLINQNAGSGGDMFPWLFRNSELGPLMGTRTWGGLVGISGRLGLVDGGGVTAPSFGIYDTATSKWIAENTGVDPDIEVDNDPAVLASGHDLQLKTAVDYLLKELASGKAWKGYKSPDFPRIKRGG